MLSKDADDIIILEAERDVGGALSSYHLQKPVSGRYDEASLRRNLQDYHVEKYYHHLFDTDEELINLIGELDLGSKLEWLRASTSYYADGKIYPMSTLPEILRFPYLHLTDIIRLGLLVLRSRKQVDLDALDEINARDWIIDRCGSSVYDNFFQPLLRSKFGRNMQDVSAAWLMGRISARSNRSTKGETLGYLHGGFHQLINAMARHITDNGGEVRLGCSATKINITDGGVVSVTSPDETLECDNIISTVPPAVLLNLIGSESSAENLVSKLKAIRYQGACCLLLSLKEPLMKDGTYWLNIREESLIGAIIEHTNLLPSSEYNNEHLVYLASYFQDEHSELWTESEQNLTERYLEALEKLFPFERENVNWTLLARDTNTAPIFNTGYKNNILPYKSDEISGLYLAGMFSRASYPERGMNNSIRAGFECVRSLLEDGGR